MTIIILLSCGDFIQTDASNIIIGHEYKLLMFRLQADGYFFVRQENIVDIQAA